MQRGLWGVSQPAAASRSRTLGRRRACTATSCRLRAVTTFLDSVGFTPTSAAATAFSFTVKDDRTLHTATTLTSQVTVTGTQNADPTLAVTAANLAVESTGAAVTPFAGRVTVADQEAADSLTMEISFASGNGSLVGQTVTDNGTTKVYTYTGTKAQLNTILSNLQFDATDRDSGGAVATAFTIKVKPAGATTWSATDSTNIVVTADPNDNATATIGTTAVSTQVGTAVNPFASIALADQESDQVTLTMSFTAGSGTWTGLADAGGVHVTDNGATTGTGVISFAGTAGAVTTFLDSVGFTPNSATATAFSFTLKDDRALHTATTLTSQVTVTGTTTNSPPTITATGGTVFTAANARRSGSL